MTRICFGAKINYFLNTSSDILHNTDYLFYCAG